MRRTVLVVDDHPSFRALARQMLEAEGFDVLGEARDAASVPSMVAELDPQVVLLDIHLPDGDGYSVAAGLTKSNPGQVVILISTHEPEDVEPMVATCGARGFIAKHELSGEALSALLA